MAQTWPVSLPIEFLDEGYKEGLPDNVLRTKMSKGPDKLRKFSTADVRPLAGYQFYTDAQLDTFITFFNSTLESGSLSFDRENPRSGDTEEMRFKSPPTWKPRNLGWQVFLDFEILP